MRTHFREPSNRSAAASPDLICLSHLRWNFVFQRPQHLMTRYARHARVYLCRGADVRDAVTSPASRLNCTTASSWWCRSCRSGIRRAVDSRATRHPRSVDRSPTASRGSCCGTTRRWRCKFSDHLKPDAVVYDCMDELSAFKKRPPELRGLEQALLRRADVVFTGGQSLYEAKKHASRTFTRCRAASMWRTSRRRERSRVDPADQRELPRPRLGFFGVLDERLDIPLLRGDRRGAARLANGDDWPGREDRSRGPAAATRTSTTSARRGTPSCRHTSPAGIVALLLFARNEATRFISPTKTPEYLAAGKPVVSTSIRDVVTPYGDRDLVRIADTVDGLRPACAKRLTRAAGAAPRARRCVPARHVLGSHVGEDRCAARCRHRLSNAAAAADNRGAPASSWDC